MLPQAFDPTKVLILGADERTATVGDPVQFQLDRKLAGYAELSVTAISPLGQVMTNSSYFVSTVSGDCTLSCARTCL